jgi:Zn-dependent peptidase ImmA (M78 family)
MLAEIPAEEFALALDECADGLLWEAGVSGPPVDAFHLAGQLGMLVARDNHMPQRAHFVRLDDVAHRTAGQDTIVLGPEPRSERRHWAVAHEIGESAAHRVFAALGVPADTAPPRAREVVANHLASALLLPRHWFAADGRRFEWDLLKLKTRYATASHELIARRMLEITPPVVITLCDQGRITWRRSNLPGRPPTITGIERQVWLAAHDSGIASHKKLNPETYGLEEVHAWPIHEPGWRREILRSEIAMTFDDW